MVMKYPHFRGWMLSMVPGDLYEISVHVFAIKLVRDAELLCGSSRDICVQATIV